MTSEARTERQDLVVREAAEWLLRLRHEPLGLSQRKELATWLRESPLNVAEFLHVSRITQLLDNYQGWEHLPADEAQSADKIIDMISRLPPAAPTGSHAVWSRHWLSLAAACAAAVAVAAWLLHLSAAGTLHTSPGERREVTLADGSIVNMAPSSEIRVRFSDIQRNLQLIHGEAFFRVHKNPQRPFVVEVSGTRVRAVGTAFSIRRDQGDSVVTVVEGVVSVSAAVPSSPPAGTTLSMTPVLLAANQQLQIPDGDAPRAVKPVNGALEVAWTAGELVFDDESLGEVVRRFNAHNRLQIVITDPVLAARHVSGVFRASDPESFVKFIQMAAQAPAVRRAEDRIYVGGKVNATQDPEGH